MAYRGRHATSEKPRYVVWTDMSFQRKAKAQRASDLFEDGRAARKQVAGTIAVGQVYDDSELRFGVEADAPSPVGMELGTSGLPDGQWLSGFPASITVDEAFLDRGANRYNIYCGACHGVRGDGLGAVALRAKDIRGARWGWVDPKNLMASGTVARKNGELFHIAGHGIATMKGYAGQITASDRWAIVAWVRALQNSQAIDSRRAPQAEYKDLPPELQPPAQGPQTDGGR
jgi:mono/diheme cytochrome c family protein